MAVATQTFNAFGYNAINLLELANKIGISRGNLTYHFKDKEVLLKSICEEMWAKIEKDRIKIKEKPSFKNLHNEVQLYFKYQEEYLFIFQDVHVLNHPEVKKKFREMSAKFIQDIQDIIAFSISIGNVKEEEVKGTYDNIILVTWLIAFYWKSKEKVTEKMAEKDGEQIIWSLMMPHFTDKGKKTFINFFGKDYFDNANEFQSDDLSHYIL